MIGDFNGDGVDDIATLLQYHLVVFLGSKSGAFTQAFSQPDNGLQLTMADFNHDGILDLANPVISLANPAESGVQVWFGQGEGQFVLNATYRAGEDCSTVAATDLNGDGFTDLAVGNSGSLDLTLLLNDGDGTFQRAGSWALDSFEGLAAGHFTRDGRLGLAGDTSGFATSVVEVVPQ